MAGKSKKKKRPASPEAKSNNKTARPQSNGPIRPSQYRKFDPLSAGIRESLLKACANAYFKHIDGRGGKCQRGFMEQLLTSVANQSSALGVTRDDINNEIRRIKAQRKNETNKKSSQVSPTDTTPLPVLGTESSLPSGLKRLSSSSEEPFIDHSWYHGMVELH